MSRIGAILCVLTPLLLPAVAAACPSCKDAVPTDAAAAGQLPGGFNTSIYLMLGGLVCVIGFVGAVMVKAVRGR